MRPVIEKHGFEPRHIAYIIILIICIISVGIVTYSQFFQDEKLGVIFGITNEKEDKEYKSLQENFLNIFDNSLNILEDYKGNINKIKEDNDIILLAENNQEQTENYTLDIKIPYFNINSDECKKINKEIKYTFVEKSRRVISSKSDVNIIYNVKYKAYLNNNILSLVILSELKEGENSERIILQAYNYNLQENRQVSISELIEQRNIDVNQANHKIKEQVNSSQEHNLKLAELGYEINIRDANSDYYKIENAEQFFIGEKGYLYIVYPYGNKEFTNEMDLIILR